MISFSKAAGEDMKVSIEEIAKTQEEEVLNFSAVSNHAMLQGGKAEMDTNYSGNEYELLY